MRILIVDDEENILRMVELNWPDRDDEIVTAASYADAKSAIFSGRLVEFDCIILDLQLPDASGSVILSEIKQIADIPVIMLSGWGDTQFRADTLYRGADDYVMKPVGTVELHARVRRLVDRRNQKSQPGVTPLRIGPCTFRPRVRELQGEETTVSLTGAEAALLESLVRANGDTVAREDLYLKAFGREGQYGDKSLETYIGRLRRRMTEAGDDGDRRLKSVRGVGYRLFAGHFDPR